nr:guanylate kinase [Bacteroidota bacterium]
MNGKMIIISAPSGSGKTTIVKEILASDLKLKFSISACSREPRQIEKNGRDYYFMTPAEFQIKIKNDEFVEWEEVYPGNYYGTLKSEVQRIWNEGCHAIFDVDVQGGVSIKTLFPNNSLSIFIQPPSVAELEQRLRNRSTESEESLKKRVEKAVYELSFSPKFDLLVVNDKLEDAVKTTYQAIKEFLNS